MTTALPLQAYGKPPAGAPIQLTAPRTWDLPRTELGRHPEGRLGSGEPARLSWAAAEPLGVTVVIPAMNEERNIDWVLRRLPSTVTEVILVDGNSTDDTVRAAQRVRPDIRVLTQHSRGKGAALALGLMAAQGDVVVMIDADGSMDPAEIPAMLGALLAGADVVKGSRAAAGGGSHDLSFLRRSGNFGLTQLANLLYGERWRELCYGYAAFWCDVLPALNVAEIAAPTASNGRHSRTRKAGAPYGHGFEIEAILFCRSARAGLRVAEVFSFEHPRREGESNLSTWRDGWRVLRAITREVRFRKMGGPSRWERRYPLIPVLHEAIPVS